LEWNESAGLYTPRSLIRKRKIYTTVETKRNYKGSALPRPGRGERLQEMQNAFFARNSEI
jgi:hypothetical protein